MSHAASLPFELVEIIFSHLDFSSLCNASYASRAFRDEMRKYLFQSFSLTVEQPTHEQIADWIMTNQRFEIQHQELDDVRKRLAFFSSPPISGYVRVCTVDIRSPEPAYRAIIDALFAQLCHWPKLTDISFSAVFINPQRVEDLTRCTSLHTLCLKSCKFAISASSPHKISTPSLYIDSNSEERFQDDPSPRWLSVFDIHSLVHLQLGSQNVALDALEEMTSFDEIPLRSLALDGSDSVTNSALLPVVLSRLPELYRLRVLTALRGASMLPIPECPSLSAFDGPQEMLKPVAETQRNLRRVRLIGTRWEKTCDTLDILLQLPILQSSAPDLESLQLRGFPTKALCTMITDLFPTLVSLAFELPVQRQREEPMLALTREPFYDAMLSLKLPPDLRNLVILCMMASSSVEGRSILEKLTQEYSSLKHVYLHFPNDYWMVWVEYPPTAEARKGKQGFQRGYLTTGYLTVRYDWF